MSVLIHTLDAFRERRAPTVTAIAMIKRFATFVGALAAMAIVVAAVGAIKLAAFWPHFAH
jgi:hypothetical protein